MSSIDSINPNISRFENAMDQLAVRVEHTGSKVRNAVQLVNDVRANPQAIVFALSGLVGGFVLGRSLGRRWKSRKINYRAP